MIIVKCKVCGMEYELDPGDNPSDFQCECGGDLSPVVFKDKDFTNPKDFTDTEIEYMNSLIQEIRNDKEGTSSRLKDMKEFFDKSNIKVPTESEIIQGTTEAYELGAKGLPPGGMRDVYRETAQKSSLNYVKNMNDDEKKQIRDLISENLGKGKGMRDIAQDLMNNIESMDRARAQAIARTETVRDKNLGNWYAAKEAGKQAFIVITAFDCCDQCEEEYVGKTFTMKDTNMLPPLHLSCRCTASFFRTTEMAKDMASSFEERFNQEQKD